MIPELLEYHHKVLTGVSLNAEQLRFSAQFLDDADMETALMANSIFVIAGDEPQARVAIDALEKICKEANRNASDRIAMLFLIVLEYVPIQRLTSNECFKALAYKAALDSFHGSRINAMRILKRLGRRGDTTAINLLRQALSDSSEYVRENAEIGLKAIDAP